jgi:hypothetical protein
MRKKGHKKSKIVKNLVAWETLDKAINVCCLALFRRFTESPSCILHISISGQRYCPKEHETRDKYEWLRCKFSCRLCLEGIRKESRDVEGDEGIGKRYPGVPSEFKFRK